MTGERDHCTDLRHTDREVRKEQKQFKKRNWYRQKREKRKATEQLTDSYPSPVHKKWRALKEVQKEGGYQWTQCEVY